MIKAKPIVLGMVAVLLVVAALVYWQRTRTPEYSLHQLRNAIRSRDVAKFEQYVDIESVLSQAFDDVTDAFWANADSQSVGETLANAFIVGLVQVMKPRAVEEFRREAIRLLERGWLFRPREAVDDGDSSEDDLRSLIDMAGADRASFRGIKYIKKHDKVALVGLRFRHRILDANLLYELKLRDMGGYWRVVEVTNLKEQMQRIDDLEKQRLAELNEAVRSEIADTLRVEDARRRSWSDEWGILTYVDLVISVRNMSTRTVTGFAGIAHVYDASGQLLKDIEIRDEHRLGPSGSGVGTWTVRVNRFDASEKRFYELPAERTVIDVEITRITFADGSELQVFQSLPEALARR